MFLVSDRVFYKMITAKSNVADNVLSLRKAENCYQLNSRFLSKQKFKGFFLLFEPCRFNLTHCLCNKSKFVLSSLFFLTAVGQT